MIDQLSYDFDYSEELRMDRIDLNQSFMPIILPFSSEYEEKVSSLNNFPEENNPEKTQSDSSSQKRRRKNKHPIKNFLALFKTAHFQWLEKMKVQVQKFEWLLEFQKKRGASKMDFVSLYLMEDLAQIWSEMFAKKYLFHYLMKSRSYSQQKHHFQNKIRLLYDAFESKQLESLTNLGDF